MSSNPSQPPPPPPPPPVPSKARSSGPLKFDPPIPEHDSTRPRTPQEAERFFRRVALENQPPSRTMRWLSIGGWVAGARKSIFSCSRERLILRIVVNRQPLGRYAFRSRTMQSHNEVYCLTVRSSRFPIVSYAISYHIRFMYQVLITHVSACIYPMPLQSPPATWYCTQTLGNANTSFHL